MIPIIHRVNKVNDLKQVNNNFGLEIDVRHNNDELVLDHGIKNDSDKFLDFIKLYKHKLLVVNVKESGIEDEVIKQLINNKINNFFLLDVEFPYILNNYQKYGQYLSLRFSAYESIESVKHFIDKVNWLWIDTYADLDLTNKEVEIIKNFKICLVSPSRWGAPENLENILNNFKKFEIEIEGLLVKNEEEF